MSQSGVRGSETTTLVFATVPGLLRVMVKVAVAPGRIVCSEGDLMISIGTMTSTAAEAEALTGRPSRVTAVTVATLTKSLPSGSVVQT